MFDYKVCKKCNVKSIDDFECLNVSHEITNFAEINNVEWLAL